MASAWPRSARRTRRRRRRARASASRRCTIARRPRRCRSRTPHGRVEVGVVEDDVRRLAAELERHGLQRLGGRGAIGRPVSVAPVNAIFPTPGWSTSASPTTGPCPAAPTQSGGSSSWSISRASSSDTGVSFGGLEDDGVACRQGGPIFRAAGHRRVPRDDGADHADGLASRVREERPRLGHGVSQDVLADSPEVLEVADDVVDLGPRLADRLAVVARLDPGERRLVGVEHRRDPPEHAGAVQRARAPPGAVERVAGGPHGAVDVVRPGLGDRRPRPADGRLEGLERPPVGAWDHSPATYSPSLGTDDGSLSAAISNGIYAAAPVPPASGHSDPRAAYGRCVTRAQRPDAARRGARVQRLMAARAADHRADGRDRGHGPRGQRGVHGALVVEHRRRFATRYGSTRWRRPTRSRHSTASSSTRPLRPARRPAGHRRGKLDSRAVAARCRPTRQSHRRLMFRGRTGAGRSSGHAADDRPLRPPPRSSTACRPTSTTCRRTSGRCAAPGLLRLLHAHRDHRPHHPELAAWRRMRPAR